MYEDNFVIVNPRQNEKYQNMNVDVTPPKMKKLHVLSNVRNRYVRTVVTSTYSNPETRPQEATFSIILPDTAFISGFIMEIQGKKYEAYVKEKEEAKQEYAAALATGRGAAHVAVNTRDSNKFNVSVNVEPHIDVTFILTYEELLIRKHNIYEIIINLQTEEFIHDLRVDVHVNETRPIVNVLVPALRTGNEICNTTTTNDYAIIKRDNQNVHITFRPTIEQQTEMAKALANTNDNKGIRGQFVVQYDVERDPLGGEVLMNDGYFVHFFAPTELKPIPKHVVFVLDISSSMGGRKIQQLQQAMIVILDELNAEDYFNIIIFNNTVQILFSKSSSQEDKNFSLPASVENINKTKKAINNIEVSGCTNICDALETAISLTSFTIPNVKKNEHNLQPMIVFLTDGQANVGVSDPHQIIATVNSLNNNKCAIFTLAFGDDANQEFLKELALKNSGFLRNIYEAADASLQLQDFYKQISSPLLTNIVFKYSENVKETTKNNYDIFFNGSEFVVAGKIDKNENDFVFVEASTLLGKNKFWPKISPLISKPGQKQKYGDLERLWAYLTIKQLLDKKYEKEVNETNDREKQEALKLALKYSFVTPVTSLIVVKPKKKEENDLQFYPVRMNSNNRRRPVLRGGGFLPQQQQQQISIGLFGSAPPVSFNMTPTSNTRRMQLSSVACHSRGNTTFDSSAPPPIWGPTFTAGIPTFPFNSAPQQSSLFGSTSFNVTPKSKQIPPFLSDIWDGSSTLIKNMNVSTIIHNHIGRTVFKYILSNKTHQFIQKTFPLVLPNNATIINIDLDIDGVKQTADIKNKEDAKRKYKQGTNAAYIIRSENRNNFELYISLKLLSSVLFTITYEEILVQENEKYTYILNLNPTQLVEYFHVIVEIRDREIVQNVQTPILKTTNVSIECNNVNVYKEKNNIRIAFKATIEDQKKIINMLKGNDHSKGICGQFVIQYDIKSN